MAEENKRFVEEFANPHSWLMMADNLHEQATEIYAGRSRSSIITKVNANGEVLQKNAGNRILLRCRIIAAIGFQAGPSFYRQPA